MTAHAIVALSWLLGAMPPASAAPRTFDVIEGNVGTIARFDSHSTLESFSGSTHAVRGAITVDTSALGDTLSVRVEVDLTSLSTGNQTRDRHMRENHLETETFPVATFTGATVLEGAGGSLETGYPVTALVEGSLALHGVTHRISVPVELLLDGESDTLHIACHFSVRLDEYRIARPGFLLLRVAEEQEITIELTANERPPSNAEGSP